MAPKSLFWLIGRNRFSVAMTLKVVSQNNESFLIVRAVKDTDPALLGEALRLPPQKIVIEFFVAGAFERMHIHAAQDVANRTVIARRIHCLEDQQKAVAVAGVHHTLQGVYIFLILVHQLLIVVLVFVIIVYNMRHPGRLDRLLAHSGEG